MPSRVKPACPNMKTQTAPALNGSSKCASCEKLTLQKPLQIIMRPSRRCATEPESCGNYGSLAMPISNAIWPASSKAPSLFVMIAGTSSTVLVCFVWSDQAGSSVPMLQSGLFKPPEQPAVERPPCPNCGRTMWLYRVQPIDMLGHEQRIFSCSECAQQKTVFVKFK